MALGADERRRLVPAAGARLLLDRLADRGAAADYAAWVLTAAGEHAYDAVLADDGTVTLMPRAAPASADDKHDLRMLAKVTARAAPRRVEDGLPAWPPRVLRWRGPGR